MPDEWKDKFDRAVPWDDELCSRIMIVEGPGAGDVRSIDYIDGDGTIWILYGGQPPNEQQPFSKTPTEKSRYVIVKGTKTFGGYRWPDDADGSLPVYFVKTHMAEASAAGQPVIHLVRDGRDAIVSLAHYARDILKVPESLPGLIDGLIEGNTTLGHWGLHTLAFAGRPGNTAYMTFDDLVRAPMDVVRHALELLELNLTACTDCTIEAFPSLHDRRPQFFRSGRTGQWQRMLSTAQQDCFKDIHGAALRWFESLEDESRYRLAKRTVA